MRPKPNMDLIVEKTVELCNTIINQPAYMELKKMIQDFLSSEQDMDQYNQVIMAQRALQQKQQHGLQLTKEDVDGFEQQRFSLYENPIIRDFMYAQQELGKIEKVISQYVIKTIDLDRIPTEDELNDDGGCGCGGGGCGCGGH